MINKNRIASRERELRIRKTRHLINTGKKRFAVRRIIGVSEPVLSGYLKTLRNRKMGVSLPKMPFGKGNPETIKNAARLIEYASEVIKGKKIIQRTKWSPRVSPEKTQEVIALLKQNPISSIQEIRSATNASRLHIIEVRRILVQNKEIEKNPLTFFKKKKEKTIPLEKKNGKKTLEKLQQESKTLGLNQIEKAILYGLTAGLTQRQIRQMLGSSNISSIIKKLRKTNLWI